MNPSGFVRKTGYAAFACAIAVNVWAAQTDIATAPLITSSSASVLPNLMFILDNSGSMAWDFTPDYVNQEQNVKPLPLPGIQNPPTSAACLSGVDGKISGPSRACKLGDPPYMSSDFNTQYYNPAIAYYPPVNSDGSSMPSQTNFTSVATDGFKIQNTDQNGYDAASVNLTKGYPDRYWCDKAGTTCKNNASGYSYPDATYSYSPNPNGQAYYISGAPYYYTITPTEYCTGASLKTCIPSTGPTTAAGIAYNFPAKVRWCDSEALTNCQALKVPPFFYAKHLGTIKHGKAVAPAKATGAIIIKSPGTDNKVTITGISVNGIDIIGPDTGSGGGTKSPPLITSTATDANDKRNALAAAITARINFFSINSGYSASAKFNVVTITAPAVGPAANGYVVDVNSTAEASGGKPPAPPFMIFSTINMNGGASEASGAQDTHEGVGTFVRTDIVPANNSYPKAATRTDCVGATCTYNEEMTNFSNWYAYYRTRMQMMKSSAGRAFNPIGNKYRVGFMTINQPSANYLKIDDFTTNATSTGQKDNWYTKFYNANPLSSTPLRDALAQAGRIFAGKNPLGLATSDDPVQYACQKNFAILTTDGYWNGDTPGYQVDGSTTVGDRDNNLPRPQLDGTGTSNTLADVAAYYYNIDLRTAAFGNCTGALGAGVDVCKTVDSGGAVNKDSDILQNMTTFTLGLGVSGYMQYINGGGDDFLAVSNGSVVNPASGVCSWQAKGTTCNWPVPSSDSQANIDDLWHAAINGHGTYFSATNASVLADSLSQALAAINIKSSSAAAATTSNPNVVSGDNFVFSTTFISGGWAGEVTAQKIDIETGAVSPAVDWTAQSKLNGKAPASRKIYTYSPGETGKLKEFLWDALTQDEKMYFTEPAIAGSNGLSQFCTTGSICLGAGAKAAAAGKNMVEFLRGVKTYEGDPSDTSKYYRYRNYTVDGTVTAFNLGDIVNSEAVYVQSPMQTYADVGYAAFKDANGKDSLGNNKRKAMIYVAANDGMLHAFNAVTGAEEWAYIPSHVLPNLFRLADKNYASSHRYFVDGTPTVGDAYFGGAWHTILIGGLNSGGRGYYALDITDPNAPSALWEFTHDTAKGAGYTTDANLGYTFGKPEISKLKNGTWVVIATSGYNNISPGDGQGHLFVLNAGTGAKIRDIPTGVGSATSTVTGACTSIPCPSGLAQIRGWADNSMFDNTLQRVYGGDLYGNLWRFDVNDEIGAAGYDAQLLATLKDGSGNLQPITEKPELGDVSGNAVVYVGTGRYMGLTDLADTKVQTIYAIKDGLGATGYSNPRSDANFIKQTLTTPCTADPQPSFCTGDKSVRTSTNLAVNFATDHGWYVDLPGTGERSYTDPQLALGTLTFTTNTLDSSSTACSVGGKSFLYFFDYRTGGSVSTSPNNVVGIPLGNALATREVLVRLPNNTVVGLTRLSDGTTVTSNVPIGNAAASTKRVSWRELAN